MGQCASGAQNAFAFAAAVENGRMPDVSTLTYQGVFNEHSFYAGKPATAMLEASSFPFMGKDGSPWLAIYLKSVLDGRPRDATPIDLSVVIDISGSMGAGMSYTKDSRLSRLDCAKRAVTWLVKEVLRDDDRISLSLFNTEGHAVHKLTQLATMDKEQWLAATEAITTDGGTTLCAGMQVGREALNVEAGAEEGSGARARRILFLTDMAEMGATELGSQIARYAEEGVYVSIVGMGVEFNAELTDTVTKNKGSIYSSATSVEELRSVVVSDFAFNSFPAAFDVQLSIRSGDLDVSAVYGTPFDHKAEADAGAEWSEERHALFPPQARAAANALGGGGGSEIAAGAAATRTLPSLPPDCVSKVMGKLDPPQQSVTEVNTFFPGRVTDGCIKGGLVLVRLASKPGGVPAHASALELTLQYSDPAGAAHTQTDVVRFAAPYLGGAAAAVEGGGGAEEDRRVRHGLRKALVLQRYCEVCRHHMALANDMVAARPHSQLPSRQRDPDCAEEGKEKEGQEDAEAAGESEREKAAAEEACVRLEAELGEVKAALEDPSFRAEDSAMAAELSARVDAFIVSFASVLPRSSHPHRSLPAAASPASHASHAPHFREAADMRGAAAARLSERRTAANPPARTRRLGRRVRRGWEEHRPSRRCQGQLAGPEQAQATPPSLTSALTPPSA